MSNCINSAIALFFLECHGHSPNSKIRGNYPLDPDTSFCFCNCIKSLLITTQSVFMSGLIIQSPGYNLAKGQSQKNITQMHMCCIILIGYQNLYMSKRCNCIQEQFQCFSHRQPNLDNNLEFDWLLVTSSSRGRLRGPCLLEVCLSSVTYIDPLMVE